MGWLLTFEANRVWEYENRVQVDEEALAEATRIVIRAKARGPKAVAGLRQGVRSFFEGDKFEPIPSLRAVRTNAHIEELLGGN